MFLHYYYYYSFFFVLTMAILLLLFITIIINNITIGNNNNVVFVSGFTSSNKNNNNNKVVNNNNAIAPETTIQQRQQVSQILQQVYGQPESNEWLERRKEARQEDLKESKSKSYYISNYNYNSNYNNYEQHQLVYGELGLDALCTILDAVTIHKGDKFLDIGSGDGHLVQAAALLFGGGGGGGKKKKNHHHHHHYLQVSRGIELLDFLYERSINYDKQIKEETLVKKVEYDDDNNNNNINRLCPTELYLGDIYSVANTDDIDTDTDVYSVADTIDNDIDNDIDTDKSSSSTTTTTTTTKEQKQQQQQQIIIKNILNDTTIAICFATTWTRGIPGRKLPKLALALKHMPVGSRIVVVDGKLELLDNNNSNDSSIESLPCYYEYHGQLQFQCPDTAPYSIAHLYERI